jgi:hypothetical protein
VISYSWAPNSGIRAREAVDGLDVEGMEIHSFFDQGPCGLTDIKIKKAGKGCLSMHYIINNIERKLAG